MEIIEKYQDTAEMWRVRVSISQEESIFLKYETLPADADILIEAQRIVDNRLKEEMEMLNGLT